MNIDRNEYRDDYNSITYYLALAERGKLDDPDYVSDDYEGIYASIESSFAIKRPSNRVKESVLVRHVLFEGDGCHCHIDFYFSYKRFHWENIIGAKYIKKDHKHIYKEKLPPDIAEYIYSSFF